MIGKLVPLSRAAKRLGVQPAELVRMSINGHFPAVYEVCSRVYRVDESEVERWLAEREVRRLATLRHAEGEGHP